MVTSSVEDEMKITIYDPPSGWRYGFPRQYKPRTSETLEQTLLRDGYPQQELDWGAAKYVRFWDTEDEDLDNPKRV